MSVVNLYLLNVNEKAKLARKKYKEKMHDLFFYYDNRQRDRLYEALMEKE